MPSISCARAYDQRRITPLPLMLPAAFNRLPRCDISGSLVAQASPYYTPFDASAELDFESANLKDCVWGTPGVKEMPLSLLVAPLLKDNLKGMNASLWCYHENTLSRGRLSTTAHRCPPFRSRISCRNCSTAPQHTLPRDRFCGRCFALAWLGV